MINWYAPLILFLWLSTWRVKGHGLEERSPSGKEPIWNQYGRSDFIVDRSHIIEEIGHIIGLQKEQKISHIDAVFYFHRLHDFNKDGYLDGIELMAGMQHALMHQNESMAEDLEKVINYVDGQLDWLDSNRDGLVDFGEVLKHVPEDESTTVKPQEEESGKEEFNDQSHEGV